jgi:hypothetical protein
MLSEPACQSASLSNGRWGRSGGVEIGTSQPTVPQTAPISSVIRYYKSKLLRFVAYLPETTSTTEIPIGAPWLKTGEGPSTAQAVI